MEGNMNNKCKINNTFATNCVYSCISYSIYAYIKKLRFPIGFLCHATRENPL